MHTDQYHHRALSAVYKSFAAWWLLVVFLLASNATQAAITFVGSDGVNSGGTPTGTSIVVPRPAGTVNGTFLIVQVAIRAGATTTITPPPAGGWTSLRQESNGSTISSQIFYKFAGASEPVSYTFTLSSGARFVAGMLAYNGVHTTSPIDVHAGQSNASSTIITAPSVIENFDNDREIWFYSQAHGDNINSPASVGTTRLNDAGGAGPNGAAILIADRQQTTATTTGIQTATHSTTDLNIGQTVALRPAVLVDHYAIDYPLGQPGVTCEAQAVRITAHGSPTDHTVLVAPSNTTQITVSTSPAAGGWALKSGGGTFLTGPGAGQAQYTFNGTEQFVELWLTQTTATTAPHININVTDGIATDIEGSVTEDIRAQFVDTAFRFFADNVAEGIGPQISGKSSSAAPGNQTIQLRAVQTNTTTGACQAALTGTDIPVELAFSCNNPTTCHVSLPTGLTITAAATQSIAGSPNAGPIAYTSVNMNFGGTGVAPFSINYADAGQITLHARKVLTATDTTTPPTTSFTLLGSSNAFVVKPAGLCVQSTDLNADCASGDATCSAFVKAGDGVNPLSRFNLIVRGVTWEVAGETNNQFCTGTNLTTPNFQLNSIPLTHSKIAPAGVENGNLAITTANIIAAGDGAVTLTSQAISEVGVFTVTATPPLYQGQSIAASTSANIGRFIPHRFTVTDNSPALANACTTGAIPFTYMDQSFYYGTAPQLTVTAVNTAGIETKNYDSGSAPTGFWKLTSTLPRNYTDQAGAAATFADVQDVDVTLTGDADFNGIGILALDSGTNGDAFDYMRVSEETPFNASIDLQFTSAGLTDSDLVCYDPDNNTVCDTYNINGVGGALLRFGRLVIGTGFGSELLPVLLPMRTEYFDGTSFITNTDDVCTNMALLDHVRLSNPDTAGGAVQAGNASMTIDAGSTSITVFNSPLVTGNAAAQFSAPGSENVGFVDITGNLDCLEPTISCVGPNTFLHLLYDWDDADGLGDGPYDGNPTGRVDFGVYEGPRTHIYTREPW